VTNATTTGKIKHFVLLAVIHPVAAIYLSLLTTSFIFLSFLTTFATDLL
jgi:hypothetical protein